MHGISVYRLDTDDTDLWPQSFDIGGHTCNQTAPTHRNEDGVQRFAVLTQNFHANGALSGNDVGIVIGMHQGALLVRR